jgi:arsenate reductase (thioredoxin)
MDFVFTVCDQAAGEVCPVWPGQPITAHWGFPDPAAFVGPEAQKRAVFADVFRQIDNRIKVFTALPIERLSRLAIQQEVKALGEDRLAKA